MKGKEKTRFPSLFTDETHKALHLAKQYIEKH